MDKDKPPTTPKKMRFAPKPTRVSKANLPSRSKADEAEVAQTESLMRRFNEKRQRPKVEKSTSSPQVVFGPGASSVKAKARPHSFKEEQLLSLPSAVKSDGTLVPYEDVTSTSAMIKREYKEPWDYNNTYYPTTLPWRRPYSGNPELLDEAEFGEAARAVALGNDEDTIKPAEELGLMEQGANERMILFQLPSNLPLVKHSAVSVDQQKSNSSKRPGTRQALPSAKGKEVADSLMESRDVGVSRNGCKLEEFSGGHMGKMLVYKSGAVKLKLGDILYDVSPGSNCTFAQDLVAINTSDSEKSCCSLGELNKKAIVTPDVDFLLDNVINLE